MTRPHTLPRSDLSLTPPRPLSQLHIVTFVYGASRLWRVLGHEVRSKNLLRATFYSPATGQTVQGSPVVVMQVG